MPLMLMTTNDDNDDDWGMMALNYDWHDENDQAMIAMKMMTTILVAYCFLFDICFALAFVISVGIMP